MDVDKSNIDKLKSVPVDISMLSNKVDDEVVKKTVCDELAKNLLELIKVDKIFKKRLNILIKRYLILVNLLWPKTPID